MENDDVPAIADESLRGRTFCLIGPESTGKTTLAAQLADCLSGVLVPEVARSYLADRPDYERRDLLEIARRQISAEATARVSTEGLVVCDTDLLVIRVWWEEKYGALPERLAQALAEREPRAYLLTAPDLDWEPDSQRENPHDRLRLFDRYRNVLEADEFAYGVVSGAGENRLRSALTAIADIVRA